MTGTPSRTARVPIVRWDLKEAEGKILAISEFPKGRKYLISLSFRGKASVRPAQVGGFDVNIVIHGSTAVRGRGDLVAYRWALWKLTAPWTHRTRPPHLGKRCAFSTSSTGPFPSNHSRKTPKGPKIALGNPDRPKILTRGTRIACEASCRGARKRRCPKPSVIRNGPVYMRRAWKEGHASYPGRSACLPRARAAERESDERAEVSRGQKGRRSDPRLEQVNPARCRGLECRRRRSHGN